MIIDEKVLMALPPPPPYISNHPYSPTTPTSSSVPPPPFSESAHPPAPQRPLKLSSLPPHILLQIVYNSFPQQPGIDQPTVERQRKTLLWLAKNLRLVNRSFYIACMHVLRSTYLPAYTSLIRPSYTSDPFPSSFTPESYTSSLNTVQRETPVLDLFIALKVREDVWVDDSELHLEREDMFKDLFDHAQPKARLEDLVRVYGVREGVITLSPPGVHVSTGSGSSYSNSNSSHSSSSTVLPNKKLPLPSPTATSQPSPRSSTSRFFASFTSSNSKKACSSSSSSPSPSSSSPSPRPRPRISPLPFSLLSIQFSTRKVGLQLVASTGAKRTIVEVQRGGREERLEVAARRVVEEVKGILGG